MAGLEATAAGPLDSPHALVDVDVASLSALEFDVVVVGSGIAGLTAALHAAQESSVALVTKGSLSETNTWYAQGGIAGAVGEADSVELHLADTLVVGQGLCDVDVVRAVVAEAPEALEELRAYGMRFDLAEGGQIALAREGGHSLPRVLHSGDATGAAVQNTLTSAVTGHERISVFERRFLVELLTDGEGCSGVLVYDVAAGRLEVIAAKATVLATGGAGQVFPVTTNPAIATGDGVAAAWRAGAKVADMEFVQFHPTALDHDSAPRFLVSEALRGEGAYLLDCDHERFMLGVHPLAELAPRDVVSREIETVMQRCGRRNVWLDARHLGREYLESRFPTIWQACRDAGYDLAADLVPVAPAAHYLIGGVFVDVDGRSSIPGLYASGEVAASGLHGANRLASNSLLEGLVFSRRIARALRTDAPGRRRIRQFPQRQGRWGDMPPGEVMGRLHALSGEHLGMARTADGLDRAVAGLDAMVRGLAFPDTLAGMQAANLLVVTSLIARAALERTESRGCHSRMDFPARDDEHWLVRLVRQPGQPVSHLPLTPSRREGG